MKQSITLILLAFVCSVNAQWSTSELSIPRSSVVTASSDNYLIFASGEAPGDQYEIAKKRIDIYDVNLGTWSSTDFDVIRKFTYVVAIESKLYIAGYSQTYQQRQNIVEVYDLETDEWTELEFPTIYGATSLTTLGAKLIGVNNGRVDMYDVTTETWTSYELSKSRILANAIGCGDKIYFAGGGSYNIGVTNVIDIYDTRDDTWSVDSLTEAKTNVRSVCVDEIVYFVSGGTDFSEDSDRIEIFDTREDTKELLEFQGLENKLNLTVTDEYLYMGEFDIEPNDGKLIKRLHLETKILDSLYLPSPRVGVGMIANQNTVYFAGGLTSYDDRFSLIDIFAENVSSLAVSKKLKSTMVYPNPTNSDLMISGLDKAGQYVIFDMMGRKMKSGFAVDKINVSNLIRGHYTIKIDGFSHKFVRL